MFVSQLPSEDLKLADIITSDVAEGRPIQIVLAEKPSRVIIINYTSQIKKEFDLSVEHDCITIEDQAENICLILDQCDGLNEGGPDVNMLDPNIYFYIFN